MLQFSSHFSNAMDRREKFSADCWFNVLNNPDSFKSDLIKCFKFTKFILVTRTGSFCRNTENLKIFIFNLHILFQNWNDFFVLFVLNKLMELIINCQLLRLIVSNQLFMLLRVQKSVYKKVYGPH